MEVIKKSVFPLVLAVAVFKGIYSHLYVFIYMDMLLYT